MKVINIQLAKTHLSRYVDQAAQGKTIVIGKHGKPLARLTAYAPSDEPRRFGGLEGKIRISPGFDDEDPRITARFHGVS